jgi:hypothetical protein
MEWSHTLNAANGQLLIYEPFPVPGTLGNGTSLPQPCRCNFLAVQLELHLGVVFFILKNWDSLGDTVTSLGVGCTWNLNSISDIRQRFLFPPKPPGRLWGPTSLQPIVYRSSCRRVKLTTHLHLVSRLRIVEFIHLHTVMLRLMQ